MSNEIQIRSSLQVSNEAGNYRSQPTAYSVNQLNAGGPSPGMITCGPSHTIVNLTQLTKPACCRIQNLDPLLTVDVGLYNATLNIFLPMLEMQPGETYVVRLSQLLGKDLIPGTGTTPADSDVNSLAVKVRGGGTCNVLVEAFNA